MVMEPNERFDWVEVEWLDSCMPLVNSEVLEEDIPEPDVITQTGYLIKRTPDYLTLAGGIKREPLCFDFVITIPLVAVLYIRTLESLATVDGHGAPK
jgi:hypothetical protein